MVLKSRNSPSNRFLSEVVLVVEDEPGDQELLSRILRGKMLDVVIVGNGEQAVESAAAYKPALILMDLSLPGIDGLEASRRIRRLEGLGEVPIIAVTGTGVKARRQALKAGINEVLPKPIDIGALNTLLEWLMLSR